MNIILLGAPGAGKGTHAKLLKERYDLTHLSTGDMLRETMQKNTILGRKIKRLLQQGKLVPDAIVTEMLINGMVSKGNGNGFILDGFPRTLKQAKTLKGYNFPIDYIINLEVKKSVAVQRMLKRGRADDTKKIITKRFEVYDKTLTPVVKYYAPNARYVRIDSNRTAEEAQREIERAISINTTMDNFDFERYGEVKCNQCKQITSHQIYRGHTFAEMSKITVCIKCGFRTLH